MRIPAAISAELSLGNGLLVSDTRAYPCQSTYLVSFPALALEKCKYKDATGSQETKRQRLTKRAKIAGSESSLVL